MLLDVTHSLEVRIAGLALTLVLEHRWMLAALYSRAADTDLDRTAIDVVDDLDPSDDLGLVLVAAAARIRLDQGAAVTARELAALTGLSAARVRQLISSGELRATNEKPQRVPAEDARRWLASRGVPGFGL